MIFEDISRAVASASDRLAAWQARVDALASETPVADPEQRARLVALRRELETDCRRVANDLLRMEMLKRAWESAHADMERHTKALASDWNAYEVARAEGRATTRVQNA